MLWPNSEYSLPIHNCRWLVMKIDHANTHKEAFQSTPSGFLQMWHLKITLFNPLIFYTRNKPNCYRLCKQMPATEGHNMHALIQMHQMHMYVCTESKIKCEQSITASCPHSTAASQSGSWILHCSRSCNNYFCKIFSVYHCCKYSLKNLLTGPSTIQSSIQSSY